MQRYAVEPTDCNTDPIAIGPKRLAFQTHYDHAVLMEPLCRPQAAKYGAIGDLMMSRTRSRIVHILQRVLLMAACSGIWLVPIVTILLYMILIQENSISASMGIATVLLTAVWVESAAIGLLLIYAVWARPWKLKGPEYDTFIKHGYAAGLTVMGAVLFVASVVRWESALRRTRSTGAASCRALCRAIETCRRQSV